MQSTSFAAAVCLAGLPSRFCQLIVSITIVCSDLKLFTVKLRLAKSPIMISILRPASMACHIRFKSAIHPSILFFLTADVVGTIFIEFAKFALPSQYGITGAADAPSGCANQYLDMVTTTL